MKYVLTILLLFPAVCQGAWYISYPLATDKQIKLTDAAFEFKLDGMQCGVSATNFLRAPDDSIIQGRTLYCWTTADTKVFVSASCLPNPLYEVTLLGITKKGKSYQPAVTCGPTK